ncbi:MAG: universal stress protein [Muribaculaceae bacterium]|nr:universal stress protein [Muribaculaceae bacterium]MDE6541119.1 universal stress protein [Muribaculaceae bacterium]
MRYITVAIHTFDRALALRSLLESEGIEVMLQNVNLTDPTVASGVRVRIKEDDLPLALRVIENADMFRSADSTRCEETHSILVPTDFSDYSMSAALVAGRLAACHSASLRLLHAFIDPYVAANMQLSDNLTYEIADGDTRERLEGAAKMSMQKFASDMCAAFRGQGMPAVSYSARIAEGVPEDAIVEDGKVNPPLLAVMGTRGSTRKEREMIGSVSAEVLDAGRFCVLTIPEPIRPDDFAELRRVLFLGTLEQTDMLALDTFARLMRPRGGLEILLMSVPSRKRLIRSAGRRPAESMLSYCREHYPDWSFDAREADSPDPVAGVLSMHAERPFDLIVVPNRRKGMFSRVFNPGPANTMLFRADIPMLVIPV